MHGLMREGWYPVAMIRLVRHRRTKGAVTDRSDLRARDACSLLYLDAIDWAGPEVGQPPAGPPPCRRTGPDTALPVLVVDDVATNLLVAQAALSRAGYRVVTAANGAQALAVICDQRIGAVLMDVSMPEMDGIEATRRIRALAPPTGRVPIIAMTAHAFGEEEARCREAGMDDFVTKPFRLAGLLPVLEQWYGGRGGGEAV